MTFNVGEVLERQSRQAMEIIALSELFKILRTTLTAAGVIPDTVFVEMIRARATFYRDLDINELAHHCEDVAAAIEDLGLLDSENGGREIRSKLTVIKGGKDAP